MPVEYLPELRQFHLRCGGSSYLAAVDGAGRLRHLYHGPALRPGRSYLRLAREEERGFSVPGMECVSWEYPGAGLGDYRVPALELRNPDGSDVCDLRYVAHRVVAGKPPLEGLPAGRAESPEEAETLLVELADPFSGLRVELAYTVFEAYPVLARSARLENRGEGPIRLEAAMAAVLELDEGPWELTTLFGAWARERHPATRPLSPGAQRIGSGRGTPGHQHNPFMALSRPGADEVSGEVLGLCLVHSGSFLAEAELHSHGRVRVRMGLGGQGFAWNLGPGESFQAPELLLVRSDAGFGGMSRALHAFLRERVARGPWRDRERPILFNSWEAAYFSFREEDLVDMAREAARLGAELFVLDDGWFLGRDDDRSSLGDWEPDPRKLPGGLASLARRIGELGMGFGLWIEPEMVSPRSRLFAERSEWAVGVPGRPRSEGRNQYVLDLANPEAVEHLLGVFRRLLSSAPISYVKWDLNRHLTEAWTPSLPPERQGEFLHRWYLGSVGLWDRLTSEFPEVLFESCSGGGGRFDAGLLAFAPQSWASDDSDAVERLAIQHGSSLAYPLSMTGAHVSAVPNHQVGRVTPLRTRGAVSFFGILGYELDPRRLSEAEREEVAAQIAFYKAWRPLFQFGDFHRLLSPSATGRELVAWQCVEAGGGRSVVAVFEVLAAPNPGYRSLRLRGLDPDGDYRVEPWPAAAPAGAVVSAEAVVSANAGLRGGDELMGVGLLLGGEGWAGCSRGDFTARVFTLVRD